KRGGKPAINHIIRTPSHNDDDEDNDVDIYRMNVEGDEGANEEDDADELYRDMNIHLEGRDIQMADVQTTQVIEDTHVTLTSVNHDGQQQSSSVSSHFVSNMLNPSPDTGIDSTPRVDVQVTTTAEPPLLFATTLPPPTISIIPHIIKEQVKEKFKVQVSKILPKIEKTLNEQLGAEVLTRSSNSSKTSYDLAADLSELELKKILIEKMESNKSIHRSDEHKNLYKALVDAYECDKLILDTYGDTVTLKRRRDDVDKDEEPSVGSNRGSKRRREGKEPESTGAQKEKTSKTSGKSTEGSKSQHKIVSKPAPAEEPMHTIQDLKEPAPHEFETAKPPTPDRNWNKTLPATHGRIQPWISNLAKKADSRTSFNELMDTPVDFSTFVMNRLIVDTLTPELLAGSTYELMKGSYKSLVKLEFFLEEVYKATTDQLDWNNPEGQQYPHDLLKPLPLIPNSRRHHVIPFDHFINNDLEYLRGGASSRKESAQDVYSKRRIISVTELQIVEWHNYKHLDWITIRRDDDKLYKFKECDFKRLRIQDIEDMLLFQVQGKLTNLTIDERFAFNVSLRMFTISVVIQRRVKDLQLGVESYQKKLNLTKLDTYKSDLKRKEALPLTPIPEYLPQTIWRRSDKDRAAAMTQAIDKQLKTRRIMRSLEKFVGGRLAMETRNAADLKKILETIEADKKEMAQKMQDDPQTLVRYLGGLEPRVANVVELHSYQTLTKLTLLPHKVDSQQRSKGKFDPASNPLGPPHIPNLLQPIKPQPLPIHSRHIAYECPNKRMISLADFELAGGFEFESDLVASTKSPHNDEVEVTGLKKVTKLITFYSLSTMVDHLRSFQTVNIEELGYDGVDALMCYHYLGPMTDLDVGLLALGSDEDVHNLSCLIFNFKVIEVFIEHRITKLNYYYMSNSEIRTTIEEYHEDMGVVSSSASLKKNELLMLEWMTTVHQRRLVQTLGL
nr:hypothetical protein [Tanacetum cinerariifolium]